MIPRALRCPRCKSFKVLVMDTKRDLAKCTEHSCGQYFFVGKNGLFDIATLKDLSERVRQN